MAVLLAYPVIPSIVNSMHTWSTSTYLLKAIAWVLSKPAPHGDLNGTATGIPDDDAAFLGLLTILAHDGHPLLHVLHDANHIHHLTRWLGLQLLNATELQVAFDGLQNSVCDAADISLQHIKPMQCICIG